MRWYDGGQSPVRSPVLGVGDGTGPARAAAGWGGVGLAQKATDRELESAGQARSSERPVPGLQGV